MSSNYSIGKNKKTIVPDYIKANEGEVPVKQFNIAILRTRLLFQKADAKIQITNKRVIFRAAGTSLYGPTLVKNEFAIDKIGGIEHTVDYRFSIFNFIICMLTLFLPLYLLGTAFLSAYINNPDLGLFLIWATFFVGIIISIVAFSNIKIFREKYILKLLPLAASLAAISPLYLIFSDNNIIKILIALVALVTIALSLLFSFNENLRFRILTDGANTSLDVYYQKMGLGSIITAFFGINKNNEGIISFAEVVPVLETRVAFEELGAIISDIQKLGDYGIEKWKDK